MNTTNFLNQRIVLLFILATSLLLGCNPPQPEIQDQFSKHIRTAEAQSPEEEKAGFKLPPGFKIELFASEPNIGKPMNISFDARGRMWVTQSNEYPFYDSTGIGPDKVTILEDTDHDGKADKFTTFADSLNIPIGIVPVKDGAIVYSIPNVYHLIDIDGDDQVDERKILLSGFEYKDTHGMINNFYRGLDGWIHADHGFSNVSKVVGTDNKEPVVMKSGNTFRFKPDGSNVEFTTTGRVNPFGYAMDDYGYMYSVDCHSSPIYQLIRGADYPHFGKTPTGIGFGPALMGHEYGSTALAGLEYYTGDQFPEDYRQNFYLGDVVKCRVFRSSMEMIGTTPVVKWEPDFIVSEDPWFRPVDVKLGPDGALYVADFYNRIIGHYEVPLDHPGRDRQRGRIWRITYDPNNQQHQAADWATADLLMLIEGLDNSALTVRMMASDQIVDRFGSAATQSIKSMLSNPETSIDQFVHGMWILYRLDAINSTMLGVGLSHIEERIRVHTLRIIFEMDAVNSAHLAKVRRMLREGGPHIKRAAVMILAKYPDFDQLKQLLVQQESILPEDTHLVYAFRQCLRDHLRNDQVLNLVANEEWSESYSRALADVMVGVNDHRAAQFLTAHLEKFGAPEAVLLSYVNHISKFLPSSGRDQLVRNLRKLSNENLDLQFKIFKSMQNGVAQNSDIVGGEGAKWGIWLAKEFITNNSGGNSWKVVPIGNYYRFNPWQFEMFEANKEFIEIELLISGPRSGQGQANSKLISPTFMIPDTLEFVVYGRKEAPVEEGEPLIPTNKVALLIDGNPSAAHNVDITEIDHRQHISWNLASVKGKKGALVVTDGSSAWNEYVGIGGFESEVLRLPKQDLSQLAARQVFACEIAKTYNVFELLPDLRKLLTSVNTDPLVRKHAADALLAFDPENVDLITSIINNVDESTFLQERLLLSLVDARSPAVYSNLGSLISGLPFNAQKNIVTTLSNDNEAIDAIIEAAKSLDISPKLLLEPRINERLIANMTKAQRDAYHLLTDDIQPFSEEIQMLIDERVAGFAVANVSLDLGAQVFQQNCSSCHQINGSGGNIGPQLDGIGNWGHLALTEKILDPNRNISKAFITYSVELNDGKVKQGLFRREEGSLRVYADPAGQEFSISSGEIIEQTALPFTIMPDNFGHIIAEKDFNHLMYYLVEQNNL